MGYYTLGAVAAVCLLATTGCGNTLTKGKARDAIDRSSRADPKHRLLVIHNPPTPFLWVGDFDGLKLTPNCSGDLDVPTEVKEDAEYKDAGILTIVRTQPCRWHATLAPDIYSDLGRDDQTPPRPGENKVVIPSFTSKEQPYQVDSVTNNGNSHATADVIEVFPFSTTLRKLASVQAFPDIGDMSVLGGRCSYDLTRSAIVCRNTLRFALVEGVWMVDLTPTN